MLVLSVEKGHLYYFTYHVKGLLMPECIRQCGTHRDRVPAAEGTVGGVAGSQQLAGQVGAEGLASLEEGRPVSLQGLQRMQQLGANTVQWLGCLHRHVGDAFFSQYLLV